jgi:hypothetical protein
MAPILSDEQLSALRFLARHRGGCAEDLLIAQGFTVGQLGYLVFAGLAKIRATAGRPEPPNVPGEDHRGGSAGYLIRVIEYSSR